MNRIHYYIEMRECEYMYILGALAKIYSFRNPREIQVDQRGQHVRRRLLTPERTPPSATQGENTARDNALSSQLPERTTTEGTMPLEP